MTGPTDKKPRAAPAGYGRVYLYAIEQGLLKNMRVSDVKTWVALISHTREGWCSVGTRRLAKLTGLKEGTVSAAIQRLIAIGEVERTWPGNGHRASYYLPACVQCMPSAQDTASVRRPLNGLKPNPFGDEAANRSARANQPLGVSRTKHNNNTEQQHAAAEDVDLIRALVAAGVGEPTRTELANRNLTPDVVRAAYRACREQGKSVGVLVQELRARADRRDVEQQATDQRKEKQNKQREADYEQAAAIDREREQIESWYAGLTEEEENDLRRRAIEIAPAPLTRLLQDPCKRGLLVKNSLWSVSQES